MHTHLFPWHIYQYTIMFFKKISDIKYKQKLKYIWSKFELNMVWLLRIFKTRGGSTVEQYIEV
jgi:hypothetical protein